MLELKVYRAFKWVIRIFCGDVSFEMTYTIVRILDQ